MDHRAELLSQVERVVTSELSVTAFDGRFYDYYMDEVPEEALTQVEHDFASEICEKLDFTAERPTAEDRQYGWIDHGQFVEWLRVHYTTFRAASDGAARPRPAV